jgi:hypothetical protein
LELRDSCDRGQLTCEFCGQEYPPGGPEANDDALTDHVMVCVEHPMRVVEKERDRLQVVVNELEEMVRKLHVDKLIANARAESAEHGWDAARREAFEATNKAKKADRHVERMLLIVGEQLLLNGKLPLGKRPGQDDLPELIWRSFYPVGAVPCCEWSEVDEDLKEKYRRAANIVSAVVVSNIKDGAF